MRQKNMSGVLVPVVLFLFMLGGCSSTHLINYNIHSEPEGAHVIYSVDSIQWIYLGVTPIDTVQLLDEKELKDDETFTLRAMRCGYLEQSKQWTVKSLLDENHDNGQVFWAPRLIRAAE